MIPDQLLDLPSQINIKFNVLSTLLVREKWKHNESTRDAISHEGMICKVTGGNITCNIGKALRDERSIRTMRDLISQKGRMRITTLDLVD